MIINRPRGAEEIEEPSSGLCNDWNNSYIHCGGSLLDVYKIDLRDFHMPTPSCMTTSNFGRHWGHHHQGLDIKVYTGNTIHAAFSGRVRVVKYDGDGYDKYIATRYNSRLGTIYGHLSEQIVSPNQTIHARQPIGLGGNTGRSTGSRLHFKIRLASVVLNPVFFFDFANQDIAGNYYVFHHNIVARESEHTTAARGTSSNLGCFRENTQGEGYQNHSSRQERNYNTDFSSHTPRNEAGTDNGRIFYHKAANSETLGTIAKQHGISVEQLCRQSHIGRLARVSEGQLLSIAK